MDRRARIVGILFLVCLAGALISGRDLFFDLTYLWAGMLVVSFIWSKTALRGVNLERQARSNRTQVGQLFVERFSIRNSSRVPKLWLETRDHSELPGIKATAVAVGLGFRGATDFVGHRASNVIVGLGSGHSRSWQVRTLCTQRGRYQLGPMSIVSGDPFGLFPVSRELPHAQHVVVLPMTVGIKEFPLPSGRLPGGEALRLRSHQVTPNAANVRDYAPGDSFGRIHWPSTARQRRLIVKEFELDPLAEIWIVLDGYSASQKLLQSDPETGEDEKFQIEPIQIPPSTEEYGVTAAASLALHFLQIDRAVGLVAYGRARHVIQPERGESQLYRLLESLAVVEFEGPNSLGEVLKVEGPRIPRGATVILITPSVSSDMLAAVRQLKYGGRQPLLVLLDSKSFGGPGGTEDLAAAAGRSGIPFRIVRCGEPLERTLGWPTRFPHVSRAA